MNAQKRDSSPPLRARPKDTSSSPQSDASPSVPGEPSATTSRICDQPEETKPHANSGSRFRGLIESFPFAVVLVNHVGEIVLVNGQAERLFGYAREELLGKSVEELVPPRFRKAHAVDRRNFFGEARTRPMGTGMELYALHRDGHEIPVEISLSPLETEEGLLISSAINDISERKRAERLRSQLEFEELASRLSTTFINLAAHRFDGEIENGLRDLAEALDLDRVSVTQAQGDLDTQVITHFWARPGVPPAPQGMTRDLFPWLTRQTLQGTMCCVCSVEDLPAEAVIEREYMQKTGVKSWLTLPLVVGGKIVGGMGASMFRRERKWDDLLITRLRHAGNIFANAVARERAEEKRTRLEQERQKQLEFEEMLAELSARFVNLPADEVDAHIQRGLERLARLLGCGRATLAQMHEHNDEVHVTHAWAAPGSPAVPLGPLQPRFPWLVEYLSKGNPLRISNPDDWPPEAVAEREFMGVIGDRALLVIPFLMGGVFAGGVAIQSIDEPMQWDEKVVQQAGTAAGIFANALVRKHADLELQQAYGEIKNLKDRLEKENIYLRDEIKLDHIHHEVIGQSDAIKRVLMKAEQVAATDSTALLLGETGTGKELIARTIHDLSSRRTHPMVKVNCAALPASLVESELFGREKGAYTGALTREIGRFELAHESTIFLDEIGELPPELQAKLLRVLQEGEFERLGSPKTIRVNVRVIAATSRDLPAAVKDRKFREDLYYRLNVFPVQLPPLRERRDDIPVLVWHFVREIGRRMGRNIESIHSATMEALCNYHWPGNVRELRNVIERYLIIHPGPVFHAELPAREAVGADSGTTLEEMEIKHIRATLDRAGWRIRGKNGAAEVLGIKPTTLESRMKKLGIVRAP